MTHGRLFSEPLKWMFLNAKELRATEWAKFLFLEAHLLFLRGSIINREQNFYNIRWLFHSSGTLRKKSSSGLRKNPNKNMLLLRCPLWEPGWITPFKGGIQIVGAYSVRMFLQAGWCQNYYFTEPFQVYRHLCRTQHHSTQPPSRRLSNAMGLLIKP